MTLIQTLAKPSELRMPGSSGWRSIVKAEALNELEGIVGTVRIAVCDPDHR